MSYKKDTEDIVFVIINNLGLCIFFDNQSDLL